MHYDDSVLFILDSLIFEDDVPYGNIRSLLRNLIILAGRF